MNELFTRPFSMKFVAPNTFHNVAFQLAPYLAPFAMAFFAPYMIAAFIVNGALSIALKIICERVFPMRSIRPDGTSWGMPSGHCQASAFVLTLLICMMDFKPWKYVMIWLCGLYMIFTRVVVFRRHNMMQAVAGSMVGIAVASTFSP